MTLTIFTTILWLFLAALWALVIYGTWCWWRDRYVIIKVDETEEDDDEDDGGIGPLSGPDGPIDWDVEWRREQTREREMV